VNFGLTETGITGVIQCEFQAKVIQTRINNNKKYRPKTNQDIPKINKNIPA
jgi:hypothetical protein